MKLASLEAIVRSLNEGNVRYLIAGGLAVNAHGYIRLTQDVDLVIALDPANRPRDIDDVQHLKWIEERKKPDE